MSQYGGFRGPATGRQTADRLKGRYQWLQSFSDDELREITYCTTGAPMSGDEEYFDISNPEQGVIQGEQDGEIPEGSCYVPRSEIRRDLWEKLVSPFQ